MKLFKNILDQLLNKEKFVSFITIDKIFLKIFCSYSDSVVFIRIKNRVLFIGVKVPQLIAHFVSLKNNILNQFLEEKVVDIIDIKFFYYNEKKTSINKKNDRIENFKNALRIDYHKQEVYSIIEKKCYKKEYHDILYQLYIKSCFYEKK
jgi:hypothetical protein